MATPNATDPTLTSSEPTTKDSESDARRSEAQTEASTAEDSTTDCASTEIPKIDDLTIEDIKPEDVKSEDANAEAEEGQGLHAATPPTMPSPPIAVTSAHWKETLENLLRFPCMASDKNLTLFRPGNPIAQIALALGVTDSSYTIIEHDWVPIAERVFEIQTCCLMHARTLEFNIGTDGWITPDITAEWCARVLHDLQGKGFNTTCTAMVPFVLRTYLRRSSWMRYRQPRGRQMHKQIMDALKPGPGSETITRCSMLANGFTSVVKQARTRRIERADEQMANEGGQ